MQEEMKVLQSENEKLKDKLAKGSLGDVMNQVKEIKGVKTLAVKVSDVDMNEPPQPGRSAEGEAGRRCYRTGFRAEWQGKSDHDGN